jgi:[acyl-carrier-protein] S-malonyltransferase
MSAYVFPGQGAQFEGMGKELYDNSDLAKLYFAKANEVLGFDIAKIMFEGSAEDLKQTKVTQPAIFLHSVISSELAWDKFKPTAVAGHSLGEFSALVGAKCLGFQEGLQLVSKRAEAMQKACELSESTMAAVLGLEDKIVEEICDSIEGIVVPANYNCPGQLVISGTITAVEQAVEKLKEAGARRALILNVGGAFHSPLMESAKEELLIAIENTDFIDPVCPIYQNVDGKKHIYASDIKLNLEEQLTSPVKWTQTIQQMAADGHRLFIEVGGKSKVLGGMIRKIDSTLEIDKL